METNSNPFQQYVLQKISKQLEHPNYNNLGEEIIKNYRTNFNQDISLKAKFGSNINALIFSYVQYPYLSNITDNHELIRYYVDRGWKFGIYDDPYYRMDDYTRKCLDNEIENSHFREHNICGCLLHIAEHQCVAAKFLCLNQHPKKEYPIEEIIDNNTTNV